MMMMKMEKRWKWTRKMTTMSKMITGMLSCNQVCRALNSDCVWIFNYWNRNLWLQQSILEQILVIATFLSKIAIGLLEGFNLLVIYHFLSL